MAKRDDVGAAFTRRYPAGSTIFEENDPGSRMYVIRSGRVRISRGKGDTEMNLAVLEAGDFFGEMALLENLPRSANAQALDDVELIEVDAETFGQMVRTNSEIAWRMMRKLASRVRDLDLRLQNLLVDGGVGRCIEVLRWLLPRGRAEGDFVRMDGSLVHMAIAAQGGVTANEAQKVYERLREAGCLREEGKDVLVANNDTLNAFSNYLELKRKYAPDPGLPAKGGAQVDQSGALNRLLRALQIDEKELASQERVLSSQYRKYLELKRRFEGKRGRPE